MFSRSSVPYSFLDDIVRHKHRELVELRQQYNIEELKKGAEQTLPDYNFLQALRQSEYKPALIAEVKKASPSQGSIRKDFDPIAIARAYQRSGATCLSVLTDSRFFQGSYDHLRRIRSQVSLPLLCKEFIVDPVQIYLARLAGADAVLLIASILSGRELAEFLLLVQSLGMEALIEVHTLTELDRVLSLPSSRLLGINNRCLADFSIDLNVTRTLLEERGARLRERDITVVSESGLQNRSQLEQMRFHGVDAVLVGSALMKQTDLEGAVLDLTGRR